MPLYLAAMAMAAMLLAGCGFQPGSANLTTGGSSTVTLLLSSTANDQLPQFEVQLTGLTLTGQSGNHVTVLNAANAPRSELIHVNGGAEPLATISLPEGVYVAATVSVATSEFVCISLNSSKEVLYAVTSSPYKTSLVTVNLPQAITVTGHSMELVLDMQVTQSATINSCNQAQNASSITPVFNLTATDPALKESEFSGLNGQVASINPSNSSFTVTAADGPLWKVQSSENTLFNGIGNLSALTVGMPVEMNAVVQQDGSLLASRISVADTNPSNLTVASGPLTFNSNAGYGMQQDLREADGYLYPPGQLPPPFILYSMQSATFHVSGPMANLQSLPFQAVFSLTNVVTGQNVSITAHALTIGDYPTYIPASTVTLIPQTINGTVSSVSTDGGFDTYTVKLAPYDLFPQLAVQPGQTTLLQHPNIVIIYADGNTQLLNSEPLAAGSVLRFNGLIFNDNGTLKMDCAWVQDGVKE